jgi:hypothetical protein
MFNSNQSIDQAGGLAHPLLAFGKQILAVIAGQFATLTATPRFTILPAWQKWRWKKLWCRSMTILQFTTLRPAFPISPPASRARYEKRPHTIW